MADTYVVQRSKKIDAAPEKVFARIVDLNEWGNWSPWDEMDPNMTKTFSGEAGTVGSSYHWTGNRKVGEGEMRITDIEQNSSVKVDLRFLKPFKSQSTTELHVAPDGAGSEVTWKMTGNHTTMTKIMGVFKSMDKMVGPDFEKGLATLKRISES